MANSKKRRQHRGDRLPDDAAFVVRGDLLDPALLTRSAQENAAIYGFFGVSVFAEVRGITWEEIAASSCGVSLGVSIEWCRTLCESKEARRDTSDRSSERPQRRG